MEELLQHCMRELAFDGDLGCDVSRLRVFIQGFYASQRPSGTQNVDDEFHTFVWALLVRQPSVRVGLVPDGGALEVYIAPRMSNRKAVAKPKKKRLDPEPAPFPALDGGPGHSVVIDDPATESFLGRLQPIPEMATGSLESLVAKYGDSLRVAVDPEACFRAITGTHIRPAKLSPMVYTALQLISRGREAGLSVVDLGKKTGYDQKTCFYLVLQLLSLDLVVKLSKGGPGGGNFCIHKYFYSRSAFWKSVRLEENMDQDNISRQNEISPEHEISPSKLQFDPIDSRHLASTELIKSRVVKLLKYSENGLHSYLNLVVAIGFAKPTKRDRRCFSSRVRELIKDKIIEKVIVPKLHGSSSVLCIRLVADPRTEGTEGIVVQPGDVGEEEQEGNALEDKDQKPSLMPVMNMTIHRQILKLLEQAGSEGLTLHDISSRLGNFDKRTVELILYRLERFPPPPHLADLAACDFIENHGRERRHRYYTLTGYLSFIRGENIDDAGLTSRYTSMDISQSGGFFHQSDHIFYKDSAALIDFEDEFKDKMKGPAPRKMGRPRKGDSKPPNENSVRKDKDKKLTSKPRGKPTKAPGLPRTCGEQAQSSSDKTAQQGRKRKRKDEPELGSSNSELHQPPKKKRVVQKSSTQRNKSAAAPMDRSEGTSMRIPEPPRHSGSEALAIPLVEGTASRVTSLDIAGTPTTFDRDTEMSLNETPQVPIPSGFSAHMEGMISHIDENSAESLELHQRSKPVSLLTSVSQDLLPSKPRQATGSKRSGDAMTDGLSRLDDHPAKRRKSGRPKRLHDLVNISLLRAENEVMRVVAELGGIASISTKEFSENYAHVLSSMVEAGEPTSMPIDNQHDRRTIRKLVERLVDRGKLKMLTTTVTSLVAQSRLATLIYEPSVAQEKLDQFVLALREDIPVSSTPLHRKLDQPMHYTRPKVRRARPVFSQDRILGDGAGQDSDRRDIDLLEQDDNTIRAGFLSEAQVVAQLYGYLVGMARRARELHQFTLAHLQSPDLSSYIVSRSERIVALPFFFHDIPVSTYCALVSVTDYSPELSQLMRTSDGRQTPVRDLSQDLGDQLKIGKATARGKVLVLLKVLTALKLVTPLQPSDITTPYLSCEPNGAHPARFDIAPTPRNNVTTGVALSYWQFNDIAPIYLYSQSNSCPPSFHRDMFVRTADESMPFWIELENAFLKNHGSVPESSMDSITGPCVCSPQVIRTLRKRRSWASSYVLSRSQKQYLQQKWTDPLTNYTPLSDEDGGRTCLEHICNITLAPLDTLYAFFVDIDDVFAKEITRITGRDQRSRENHRERQATEDRALLAKKATEARQHLEANWDALVSRVDSGPLPPGSSTKLKALRTQYLQSRATLTIHQWENAVTEAISGSKQGKNNLVLPSLRSNPRKPSRTGPSRLLPVTSEQPKSISELIQHYTDKVTPGQKAPSKKKKGMKSDAGNANEESITIPEPPRRQRFQWTAEYDELARDVSVIIRARCRTWHRMDWTALDQLFPFLPRNSVRQRLVTLRQEAGAEPYLRVLEDRWHKLWLEYKGTETLPDDNPGHPSDFDAIAHVEFLRKYIDKRALRAGLPDADVRHETGAVLTKDIADFLSRWEVEEHARATSKMDFMWSSIGDEHREKTLLGEAFSTTLASPPKPPPTDSLLNGVAESVLKMSLTTPDEDYVAEDAALLLGGVGQQEVRRASEDLLSRGVIAEVGNSRRKTPGRKLKISDLNKDALGGSFRRDIVVDARAIEDVIEDDVDNWREWPRVCTDGEMTAFIELVSEGRVEFHIDVSEAAAHRQELDWNSKKVDDDQIETSLTMRCPALTADPSEGPSASPVLAQAADMELDGLGSEDHGSNCGLPAPCRQLSKGIITCMACIDMDQQDILMALEPEERGVCLEIIEKLDRAGRHGLSYESFTTASLGAQGVHAAVRRLTSSRHPLCYWVGYAQPVLVSRRHIRDWTVSLPDTPLHFLFPRRWLNIKGERMNDVWNAGLRAVAGVLVVRPGISQAELRQRLVSVYDRQELNDLLEYLCKEEMVVRQTEEEQLISKDIREMGGADEQAVYWSLNAATGSWYCVG